MAQIAGTNISAGVRPNDTNDVYDTHDAKYGKGGWHTGSATIADRNAITLERRDWYMVVPLGDGTKYELVPGLSSNNLADNGNWRELSIGGDVPTILYPSTGQNTDGAMTQKATTDALATKAALSHTHTASQVTDFAAAADARIAAAAGVSIAPVVNGKVPAAYLPAYISSIDEYDSLAVFPAVGTSNVIYVAKDTNLSYRWTGTQYTKVGDGQGVESFNGRTGNIVLTQADVDAFLVGIKNRLTEAETDITQLEADVTRIDGEVDDIQQVIPANASPTNKLATMADLTSAGSSAPVVSFVATRTLGGISAGQTVQINNDETGKSLKLMLAPADAPTASLNAANSLRERGSATAVVLNWSVQQRTNAIASIQVAGQSQNPAQAAGSVNVNTAPDTDTNFSMAVADTAGLSSGADTWVYYRPARFFGASALQPAQMLATLGNGSNIDAGALGLGKELAGDYRINRNYDCSGGKYIYCLWDASYGVPGLVRSGLLDFSAYTVADVTIRDIFGVARAYKLLYTGVQFGAAVNLNIIS